MQTDIEETTELEDTNVRELVPLVTPAELKRTLPNRSTHLVERARQEIRDILHGSDGKRLVVVVGPCSIHDVKAAGEYAGRLLSLRKELEDELVLVMRTYFEKPRTTVGWKGLVYDPQLDGSEDIPTGLEVSRQLLVDLNELGMPCGVEVLDPITPQYFADLVAWASVGARTVESQVHRQLASGLSMPVGFKNSTAGSVEVAVHGISAAVRPHTFFGINEAGLVSMVRTRGNPDTHLVLRGGGGTTNYDLQSVQDAIHQVEALGIARPVMIDCSHGNSHKDYRRQPEVVDSVIDHLRQGNGRIMGLMLESHLFEGRQDWSADGSLSYGISITDACVSWETTEGVLRSLASAVRSR